MAPRSTWKGFLKLSLVSVPVKAYTAVSSGSEVSLNQLHKDCNSRINYKKSCPIHGEVKQDEIVSGYEYAKDQYVVIDTGELDKLRTEDDKAVKINSFISPDQLDPIHLTGKCYYLVPDGPVAQRPYAVLHQAMVAQKKNAIAQVVLHGKEQVVLVRPIDKLLSMSPLTYEHQITSSSTFDDEVPQSPAAPDELDLANKLIAAATAKKFDFSVYKDVYTERLTKLIEAKVAGQEIVAAPAQEQSNVINLMDALRESVAKLGGAGESAPKKAVAAKPPKKLAPSKVGKATEAKKRKTS